MHEPSGLEYERAEEHAHDAKDDGAEEGGPKACNKKAGDEIRGQLQHERVDNQQEKSKCKQGERQRQELEDESKGRVDEADNDGRDERSS